MNLIDCKRGRALTGLWFKVWGLGFRVSGLNVLVAGGYTVGAVQAVQNRNDFACSYA